MPEKDKAYLMRLSGRSSYPILTLSIYESVNPNPTSLIINRTVAGAAGAFQGNLLQSLLLKTKGNPRIVPKWYKCFDSRFVLNDRSPPSFTTVYKFMYSVFRRAQVEPEAIIAAWIFASRFFENEPNFSLHEGNWRRFVLTNIVLASKALDDVSCSSHSFSLCAQGELSISELNACERHALKVLDFRLFTSADDYRVAYYELKAVSSNLVLDKLGEVEKVEREIVDKMQLPPIIGAYHLFGCVSGPSGAGIGRAPSPLYQVSLGGPLSKPNRKSGVRSVEKGKLLHPIDKPTKTRRERMSIATILF